MVDLAWLIPLVTTRDCNDSFEGGSLALLVLLLLTQALVLVLGALAIRVALRIPRFGNETKPFAGAIGFWIFSTIIVFPIGFAFLR